MSDTISRALERARVDRKFSRLATKQAAREHAYQSAKPVEVSQSVMEQNRVLTELQEQRILDCYQLLRARVVHRLRQHSPAALGITSPVAKDGKTLTAVNLAISIAMSEPKTVLLVDADVRRPSMAELFGIDVDAGLGDYLAGDVGLDDVLLSPSIEGLVLLPGRPGSSMKPEAISSERLFQLVMEVKQRNPHGMVIFDLPPVLVGGDVVTFAPHLDATLLVVADGQTGADAVRRAMPLLEGVNVIGTVLNHTDELMRLDDYYSGR